MHHEVNNTELMPMANTGLHNTAEPTTAKHKNILSFQEFVAGGSSDTENLPVPAQQMDGPTNPGMDLTFMDEPDMPTTDTEVETDTQNVDTETEETETDNTETESDSQNMDQPV
jgi:hypothetical protein